MDAERVAAALAEWGEPRYRLDQALQAQAAGAESWRDVSSWPASLRERASGALLFWEGDVAARALSRDGTLKWGLRAADGAYFEAVLIAHARGRRTLCVSSQAGCALACRFCATGDMGAGRDLTRAEIVDQAVRGDCEATRQDARLTNLVFMGMGEPMQNLDAVFDACRTINDERSVGIGARRIAISTVGWVPGIARLMDFELPVRLAVSLHASDDDVRSRLMPINQRWPIANLMAACRRYCDRTGRRVFIEYLLLDGVNDRTADALRLVELLRDGRFHVNLIEYNPTAGPWRASPTDRRAAFVAALESRGVDVSVRHSRGADIAAACGQLAAARA